MSISQKIANLITAANAVTGESRTDLTACIQDLKDGYGKGGLPEGLQRCEYIQNTSKAYIRTNVIPQSNDIITIDFQMTATTGNPTIIGCTNASYGTTNRCLIAIADTGYFQIADASWQGVPVVADTNRHIAKLDLGNGKFYLDGNEVLSYTPNFGALNYPLGVFARNIKSITASTDTPNSPALEKVYNVQVERSSATILNLLPSYRLLDNVIGMYDSVCGGFFINYGSGTFTKGADV